MLALTYEDRATELVGIKLLVLSLARHCPDLTIEVTTPLDDPPFRAWLARQPNARRGPMLDEPACRGFNVKPALLLRALAAGHVAALWLDADLILGSDPRRLWEGVDATTLVTTQEFRWGAFPGGTHRTEAWGLPVGRSLPWTCNSSVVRATGAHRGLLRDWAELLATPAYQHAQTLPWRRRPLHMLGDQEVLTALLGSTRHAGVPLHYLRRGRDIIHHGGAAGYTVGERLGNVARGRDIPPLVHTQGRKPWNPAPYHERLYLQLSPYTALARSYRDQLDEPAPWLDQAALPARVLRGLALGDAHLAGLPLALVDGVMRRGKRALGLGPWTNVHTAFKAAA